MTPCSLVDEHLPFGKISYAYRQDVPALTIEVVCYSDKSMNFYQTVRRNIAEYCSRSLVFVKIVAVSLECC